MKPFVRRMREWGYRVLSYIDDFLITPAIGRAATSMDCISATKRIDELMQGLGIARGTQLREHGHDSGALGFVWDSGKRLFTVTKTKQENVRAHAISLLKEMARGNGWVSRDSLRSFAGVVTSLHLAVPLALFYTRSIHDVLGDYSEARKPAARDGKRVKLSLKAKLDLKKWRKLGEGGRFFVEPRATWALHTDAAELGWGGTGGPD